MVKLADATGLPKTTPPVEAARGPTFEDLEFKPTSPMRRPIESYIQKGAVPEETDKEKEEADKTVEEAREAREMALSPRDTQQKEEDSDSSSVQEIERPKKRRVSCFARNLYNQAAARDRDTSRLMTDEDLHENIVQLSSGDVTPPQSSPDDGCARAREMNNNRSKAGESREENSTEAAQEEEGEEKKEEDNQEEGEELSRPYTPPSSADLEEMPASSDEDEEAETSRQAAEEEEEDEEEPEEFGETPAVEGDDEEAENDRMDDGEDEEEEETEETAVENVSEGEAAASEGEEAENDEEDEEKNGLEGEDAEEDDADDEEEVFRDISNSNESEEADSSRDASEECEVISARDSDSGNQANQINQGAAQSTAAQEVIQVAAQEINLAVQQAAIQGATQPAAAADEPAEEHPPGDVSDSDESLELGDIMGIAGHVNYTALDGGEDKYDVDPPEQPEPPVQVVRKRKRGRPAKNPSSASIAKTARVQIPRKTPGKIRKTVLDKEKEESRSPSPSSYRIARRPPHVAAKVPRRCSDSSAHSAVHKIVDPVKPRRGRPPGSKNKAPKVGLKGKRGAPLKARASLEGKRALVKIPGSDQPLLLQKTKNASVLMDPATGENFFLVEKVLNYKRTDDGHFYLVKWRGFPKSQNSWEPADSIVEGAALLALLYLQNVVDNMNNTRQKKKVPKRKRRTPATKKAVKALPVRKCNVFASRSRRAGLRPLK